MGPVWAYWAFLMGWYYRDIGYNIRSRQFSYTTINKYITSQAQLNQVVLLYGLHDQVSLYPPQSHHKDLKLPSCESIIVFDNLVTDFSNLDPLYALTPPIQPAKTLFKPLWTTLTATLATHFKTSVSII